MLGFGFLVVLCSVGRDELMEVAKSELYICLPFSPSAQVLALSCARLLL